jgi:thiol-disulfide isomerase/thioredoxin
MKTHLLVACLCACSTAVGASDLSEIPSMVTEVINEGRTISSSPEYAAVLLDRTRDPEMARALLDWSATLSSRREAMLIRDVVVRVFPEITMTEESPAVGTFGAVPDLGDWTLTLYGELPEDDARAASVDEIRVKLRVRQGPEPLREMAMDVTLEPGQRFETAVPLGYVQRVDATWSVETIPSDAGSMAMGTWRQAWRLVDTEMLALNPTTGKPTGLAVNELDRGWSRLRLQDRRVGADLRAQQDPNRVQLKDLIGASPPEITLRTFPSEHRPEHTIDPVGDGDFWSAVEDDASVWLLDFWAMWCGPCKRVMPILSDWQQEYGDAGLRIVSLCSDGREANYMGAKGFAQQKDLRQKMALVTPETFRRFGIVSIPTIVIVKGGRDGEIVYAGRHDDKLERRIRTILGIDENSD